MKILFLSHRFYPYIGGIEVNSEILANEFHKLGHEIRLLTWSEQSEDRVFPFAVIRKPSLARLMDEHKHADVVFENNPCLRLAWPAIFFNKPSVIALRTWISRFDGKIAWQDKLKYIWIKRASDIIAVSQEIKKECAKHATVIGNPYRSDSFQILSDVERVYDFVFLGRLVSDKGVAMAIDTFSKLVQYQKFNYSEKVVSCLTIIGDGPERLNLEQKVYDLQIQNHVHFTGTLKGKELVEMLNMHRFILVPSLWKEPFGNVALEGLACGCLPIVSDGGGLPDAVGKAGLTFNRGDSNDLLRCMKDVLYDKAKESETRSHSKEHLRKHEPGFVALRYLEVINSAVNKASKL